MSQLRHLKKAVQILRDRYADEIRENYEWSWNLKGWTIQFVTDYDFESVTAYKVKNGNTNWSDYIKLEARSKEWHDLMASEHTNPKFEPAQEEL